MLKLFLATFVAIILTCLAIDWPMSCMEARTLRALTGNEKITCATVFFAGETLRVNSVQMIPPTPLPVEATEPFTDEE